METRDDRTTAIERLLVRAGTLKEKDVSEELERMRAERMEKRQRFWDRIEIGSEIRFSYPSHPGSNPRWVRGIVIFKSETACEAITFKVQERRSKMWDDGGRLYRVGEVFCITRLDTRFEPLSLRAYGNWEVCPSVD